MSCHSRTVLYEVHQFSCFDVNECKTGAHACHDTCLNLIGGYKCACLKPGRVLAEDGYSANRFRMP